MDLQLGLGLGLEQENNRQAREAQADGKKKRKRTRRRRKKRRKRSKNGREKRTFSSIAYKHIQYIKFDLDISTSGKLTGEFPFTRDSLFVGDRDEQRNCVHHSVAIYYSLIIYLVQLPITHTLSSNTSQVRRTTVQL